MRRRLGTHLVRAALLAALVLVGVATRPASAAADDPLAPLPAERFTLADARHLLDRAGFGGTPEEVKALFDLGLEGAVHRLVRYQDVAWRDAPRFEVTVRERPGREALLGKTEEERREVRQTWQREDAAQARELKDWWIRRMITTPRPLEERMTLVWHGLFTSAWRSVRSSYHLYEQNTTMRGLATGSFRRLLQEMARDAAMLRYLDGDRNVKGHPNENFAREVMELFTLGIGHYTESDVKEAARAFTGWTVNDGQFAMNRAQHDDGEKTVLGKTGRLDGQDVLEILLAQDAAPRHLAQRLLACFVEASPPDALVEAVSGEIRRSDYEIAPVLEKIFASRAFYDDAAVGTKIKSPVDLVAGLFRTLGVVPPPRLPLGRLTAFLGQDLFDPPNVKGWDGGRAWITTGQLLARYNVALAVVGEPEDRAGLAALARPNAGGGKAGATKGGAPKKGAPAGGGDTMRPNDARRAARRGARGRGGPDLYDAERDLAARGLKRPADILDHYESRLLARPLALPAHAALLGLLQDPDVGPVDARVHAVLRLLVSSPEFQLR